MNKLHLTKAEISRLRIEHRRWLAYRINAIAWRCFGGRIAKMT